jgi:DNA repair protein RecO (recombination protein O)
LPLVERVYRIDTTVADRRAALFGQDIAHGYDKGQREEEGFVPTAAPGA